MNGRCAFIAATALASVALAGCVTERAEPANNVLFGTEAITKENSDGTRTLDPERILDPNARITTLSQDIRTELIPLGRIEFDMQTFPLVSPGGEYIATETGIAPTMATILGQPDASVPTETRIEIHRIVPASSEDEERAWAIELVTRLEGEYLLGRSCNEQGFLIEAPQSDGSRWLGFASWSDGEVTWIAQDEFVNAFAVLGPRGRIAWSRRAVDELNFHLVVMMKGSVYPIGGEEKSWLFPTWTQDGFGLFAVTIGADQQLDAVFMLGETEAAMRQSRRMIPLLKPAGIASAYQMHAPNPLTMGLPAGARPSLVFYHPGYRRMSVWRPLRNDRMQALRLDFGSAAGVMDDQDYIVLTLADKVVGQPLEQPDSRTVLAPMAYLPRLTMSRNWRYVMFAPLTSKPTTLQVVGMNLAE